MRVAVFTDADFDRASSVTTTLGALLRHAPPDVRPRIYTFSDLEVDEPGYLALRSPAIVMPAGIAPLRFPRLRELARRLRSDDVGAIHVTTPGPAGLAARLLAHRMGLPLVGSLHRPPLTTGGGHTGAAVVTRYLRWVYDGCAKVLVPSSDAVQRLARAGWNADRLAVWPGAVDAESFSPARRSQRLRSEWHVSDRRPAILFVGPLTRESGVELIEPLGSLLHRRGIAHRFVVVGDGTVLQGLRDRCPDAVFAGRLSHRDLATVMASADVLLRPGDPAAGLVLLEAQASGLPVLVSGGSARDHMRPGVTGLSCDPGDVLGLAARASELLTDGEGRRVMGAAARRFAQSRAWPTSLDRVYSLYRAVSQLAAGADPALGRAQASARVVRAGR